MLGGPLRNCRISIRYARMTHQKCRRGLYPKSDIKRFEVPKEKVPWSIEYPEYKPVSYTAAVVQGKPWADPEINEPTFKPKWNMLDGNVNRKSFVGNYITDPDGCPLNPVGRTGIIGRGLLGRWGPNHAADPIVTRWKRNRIGTIELDDCTRKPRLQFVAIERQDSGEWAIPGGMVDPGELVSAALMREFMEEALNFVQDGLDVEAHRNTVTEFFEEGEEIYKGYVDDPRNTDNAWMETVAMNFHEEYNGPVAKLMLKAGDDARNVQWMDVDGQMNLYANHSEFIKKTALMHDAHW